MRFTGKTKEDGCVNKFKNKNSGGKCTIIIRSVIYQTLGATLFPLIVDPFYGIVQEIKRKPQDL